jgi:hypothetical protein
MTEKLQYLGVPKVHIEVAKQIFQYTAPVADFDLTVDDFYQSYGDSAIKSDNVWIFKELGVAMVSPLWACRNNFVEGSVPNSSSYWTEHPANSPYLYYQGDELKIISESEEEINRRVFIQQMTLFQWKQKTELNGNYYADYKEKNDSWPPAGLLSGTYRAYKGPDFSEEAQTKDCGPVNLPVSWIYQKETDGDCEWILQQKQKNFTNQSFWIKFKKYSSNPVTAENITKTKPEESRYLQYGGIRTQTYFAIRIGWNNPQFDTFTSNSAASGQQSNAKLWWGIWN